MRIILAAAALCFLPACSTVTAPDGTKTTSLDPDIKAGGKNLVLAVIQAGEVRVLEQITGRPVQTVSAPIKVTASGK